MHMRQRGTEGDVFILVTFGKVGYSPRSTYSIAESGIYSAFLDMKCQFNDCKSCKTVLRLINTVWCKQWQNERDCVLLCYFLQSPSLALSIRAVALGDWALHLSAASSHLPWKSRLFPPYASMFCQASPVCSALSKFHYGMAGSTLCCSLRLSAWHVTVCNTRDAGGWIPPAQKIT